MSVAVSTSVTCIACGSARWAVTETCPPYHLATCQECGVTFTVNSDYRRDRYVAVYDGVSRDLPLPAEHTYIYNAPERRLSWETRACHGFLPAPHLTAAERLAFHWVKRHAPPRAVIIDCGCGTGRFLRRLASTGLQGVGIDLSPTLVAFLTRVGVRAALGSAPDFPWEGPAPFAIMFFEVLEHFADPGPVIARLRTRFPGASLVASVPSPLRVSLRLHGRRDAPDFPPNHYARWTATGLDRFFRRNGYPDVQILSPAPVGSEMLPGMAQIVHRGRRLVGLPYGHRPEPPPATLRDEGCLTRLTATAALWSLKAYQTMADAVGWVPAVRARWKGATSGSLLGIARPSGVS